MQQLPFDTLLQGGKYKIEKVLGQGGFGITYLAEQVMLGRKVAIKEFFMKNFSTRTGDTTVVTSSQAIGIETNLTYQYKLKFLKEAHTISKLNHSNIIKILDVFEENNTAYYVMPYIDGCSLEDYIKEKGVLSEDESLNFTREIASALNYTHNQKICHLDVKPSNIMIRYSDHKAILIDFGLSKQYNQQSGVQTSSTPIGFSQGYAPIEQYRSGGISSFSPQTDIYGLGATLYKMVSGVTPPPADEVLSEGLPTLSANLSASTKEAIYAAMRPIKKDRPSTIGDFVTFLDNRPTSKNTLWISILIVVVVASTIVFYFVNNNSAESQPNNTPQLQVHPDTTNITIATQEENISNKINSFISSLPHNARVLGKNNDGSKVYFAKGATNDYHFYYYDGNTTHTISCDNIDNGYYLYVYEIEHVQKVNNNIYIISSTGACGSGDENCMFYINTMDNQIYFFDSGNNMHFTSNNKVYVEKRIVTNYETATSEAEYNYETTSSTKTLH